VGNLRAEPREAGVLLSWTRPTRNNDASPLTDLLEFRLFRAVLDLGQPTAPASAFSFLAAVRAENPENASVQGSLYVYRDDAGGQGLGSGRQYRYRVTPVNRRGETGVPSGEVFVDLTAAAPAPVGLKAVAGDGTVDLEWQAPEDATLVKGYNLYRGTRPGEHGLQPVNPRPVAETRFRDAGLENDTPYYYVARSVSNDRPPWRESADSASVSVVPQDFIPPAPPRSLVAVPGAGIVALTWDAGAERDILGYLVYRRELPEVVATLLTPSPIPGTTYADRTARPGVTYMYAVTAVDRSARRNESAPSPEVEARLP
jgi:fibronectin type 3 domain-containing protein